MIEWFLRAGVRKFAVLALFLFLNSRVWQHRVFEI